MREAEIKRKTAETEIELKLNLDGSGQSEIETPVPFMNHMLNLLARHSLIDLKVIASGDIEIDAHHTVEDLGIVLGQALKQALGDKKGVTRYGSVTLPMDEALLQVAIDLGGRSHLSFAVDNLKDKVGDFDTELVAEFFQALVREAGMGLHIRRISGENTHHIIEGIFKALARSLREAVTIDERIDGLLTTKEKFD